MEIESSKTVCIVRCFIHKSKNKKYCISCGNCKFCEPNLDLCQNVRSHLRPCGLPSHQIQFIKNRYCPSCRSCIFCPPKDSCETHTRHRIKPPLVKCIQTGHRFNRQPKYCLSCGICKFCPAGENCQKIADHVKNCDVVSHKRNHNRYCEFCLQCLFCKPVLGSCVKSKLHQTGVERVICHISDHRTAGKKYCDSCGTCKFCQPKQKCKTKNVHIIKCNINSHIRYYNRFCSNCRTCIFCAPKNTCKSKEKHIKVKGNPSKRKISIVDSNAKNITLAGGDKRRKGSIEQHHSMDSNKKIDSNANISSRLELGSTKPNNISHSVQLLNMFLLTVGTEERDSVFNWKDFYGPDKSSAKKFCRIVFEKVLKVLCPSDYECLKITWFSDDVNNNQPNKCISNLADISLCNNKEISKIARVILANSIDTDSFETIMREKAREKCNIDPDTAKNVENSVDDREIIVVKEEEYVRKYRTIISKYATLDRARLKKMFQLFKHLFKNINE